MTDREINRANIRRWMRATWFLMKKGRKKLFKQACAYFFLYSFFLFIVWASNIVFTIGVSPIFLVVGLWRLLLYYMIYVAINHILILRIIKFNIIIIFEILLVCVMTVFLLQYLQIIPTDYLIEKLLLIE